MDPPARSRVRSPLVELTIARFRMFVREPSALFWTFGFPVLLSVSLGIAFRDRPPDPVLVVVQAGEGAEAVREVLARSPDVKVRVEPEADAARALRVGKAQIVVVPGASGAPRTYVFDEHRPECRLARAVVDDRLQRAEGRVDPTEAVDRRVTEPGSRYIDFLLPGLIGTNVMSSGMWGIGYLIVEMRTRKLIKRLVATPMRRTHFLLSFVLMRALFLFFEVPVLLTFGWLAFGVTVRGSLPLFGAMVLLGSLSFAGLGLLASSRAENTQTVAGLINLVMLPMFMLSGVFFSSANFPDAMQPVIRALPLTALNDSLRAIANEGAGPAQVAGAALVLALWAVGTFALALRLFRWR